MKQSRWLALPALTLACASSPDAIAPGGPAPSTPRAHPVRALPECTDGSEKPTRAGFMHEVLFAAGTARTPRFDAYTPDSYGMDKLDLLRGLPGHAQKCQVKLRAALVVGPVGMLWSYHVAALLDEGMSVRLNTLVMPHARITGKGSGLLSASEAEALLTDIERAASVQPGLPKLPLGQQGDEYAYGLLLARYAADGTRYFHAELPGMAVQPTPEALALTERVNALLSKSTTTYRTSPRKSE